MHTKSFTTPFKKRAIMAKLDALIGECLSHARDLDLLNDSEDIVFAYKCANVAKQLQIARDDFSKS